MVCYCSYWLNTQHTLLVLKCTAIEYMLSHSNISIPILDTVCIFLTYLLRVILNRLEQTVNLVLFKKNKIQKVQATNSTTAAAIAAAAASYERVHEHTSMYRCVSIRYKT